MNTSASQDYLELVKAGAMIRELQQELAETQRGLLALTMELEDRVDRRTAELRDVHAELKKTNSELMQMTLELEERVNERTAQLQKSNESLQAEIAVRKQAEERLRQANENLARSNKDLEQFAYVASHDLQEPLRTVAGFTQLLGKRYKGRLDQDADEFIEFAVQGAKRMQTLIMDLLSYSRLSTRSKPFAPTDCDAVLAEMLVTLQSAILESGAVITHDPLPTVSADPSQLRQVFQNLIGNAVKFRSGQPCKIHVSAENKDAEWVFSVHDNGIGIAREYSERIFVIFQRLHGREEYPGTGIGLSICKRVVERHGGRIWVESRPEEGSTFYFTLPAEKRQPT